LYCGQSTLVNHQGPWLTAKVLRCRSWTCADCAPGRHRQLVAEACGGRPNRFVTLTLPHEPGADPTTQGKRLSHAWRLICKRISRADGGRKVEYLARLETTKRGTPHLHVLCRSKWIDQRQLSLWAAELLNAPIVYVQRIDNARNVAAYVAKYLTKQDVRVGTCKRYWQTKGYDLRPPAERSATAMTYSPEAVHKAPIASVAKDYAALGYEITWAGPNAFHAIRPDYADLARAPPRSPLPDEPAFFDADTDAREFLRSYQTP